MDDNIERIVEEDGCLSYAAYQIGNLWNKFKSWAEVFCNDVSIKFSVYKWRFRQRYVSYKNWAENNARTYEQFEEWGESALFVRVGGITGGVIGFIVGGSVALFLWGARGLTLLCACSGALCCRVALRRPVGFMLSRNPELAALIDMRQPEEQLRNGDTIEQLRSSARLVSFSDSDLKNDRLVDL